MVSFFFFSFLYLAEEYTFTAQIAAVKYEFPKSYIFSPSKIFSGENNWQVCACFYLYSDTKC